MAWPDFFSLVFQGSLFMFQFVLGFAILMGAFYGAVSLVMVPFFFLKDMGDKFFEDKEETPSHPPEAAPGQLSLVDTPRTRALIEETSP